MPGLDKTRFVDMREDLEDEFTCGICQEIFNKPMVAPCCRQTFCDDCIREWLRNNNTCPNDRAALSAGSLYQAPNAMQNILNGFRIRCEYSANGCPHICPLEQLDAHMRNGCNFNPARLCRDCGSFKDENCEHNCIQVLCALTRSSGESVRDILPVIVEAREEMERHCERYDIEISSMSSIMDGMKINEIEINTKVDSLSETVNTLLNEITKLKEEIRDLKGTGVLSPSNDNCPSEGSS